MLSVYYETSTGRFICKHVYQYKGIKFTVTGTSRKGRPEARRAYECNCAKRRAQVDGKIAVQEGKVKFEKSLNEWYDVFMRPACTPRGKRTAKTIITDEDTIAQLCKYFGNMQMCDITREVVQKYLNSLQNMSQSTIRKRWNMLNMFFEYYCGKKENIMNDCKKPYSEKTTEKKDALSDSDMEILSKQLRKPYNPKKCGAERGYLNGELLVVMQYQFLRAGEGVELRRKDVDLENNMLKIERQYREETKEVVNPKYDSIREMPISGKCLDILIRACEGKEPEELLFPAGNLNGSKTMHDGHILQSRLRDTLKSACNICGVEQQTVHDLRHNGISHLVRLGMLPHSIQRCAGHSSLHVTYENYFRQTKEMDDADVQKMWQDK